MTGFEEIVGGSALEDAAFTLGIVRLSPERTVLYMNRAAIEMVGGAMKVGTNLKDLALDEESRKNLNDALSRRFNRHQGNSYQMTLPQGDRGVRARVLNSAVPQYDETGKLVGSIGFFVDQTIDLVSAEIHQIISNACDGETLLRQVTAKLREVIEFDTIVITGISQNRNHLRSIFEDPPPPIPVSPTRWWPMRPFIRTIIENFKPGPHDLKKLMYSPEFDEYAKSDSEVERFRKREFVYDMRLGIQRGGRLIATVSVMRKENRPFNDREFDRFSRLPVIEAVNAALSFEDQRNLKFGFDFVHSITTVTDDHDIAKVADDSQAIAQQLVAKLAAQYEWDHVSLFRLNKEQTHLELICQAGSTVHPFPEKYSQHVSIGMLGKAVREKGPVNVGNVTLPEHAAQYHTVIENMLSELVIPVPGTDFRWFLNVESRFRDAFADDEQQSVTTQLRVAGFILERMAALEQQSAIVSSVADAVIQTNGLDVIVEANWAAEKLLGITEKELRLHSLTHFLVPNSDSWTAEDEAAITNVWETSPTAVAKAELGAEVLRRVLESPVPLPVKLQRKDGVAIPVLLSAADLKTRVGGRVFVASDLRRQQQLQRLEAVTNVYHQLASELRIPLSLAVADLRDAAELVTGEPRELIDRSVRQIRKSDVPLERLMRLAVRDEHAPLASTVFDLHGAIAGVVDEMPVSERTRIDVMSRPDKVLVRAPRHELLFCVRSLLAYLVRRRAEVETVRVVMTRREDRGLVWLTLPETQNGQIIANPAGSGAVGDQHTDQELDLELAEPVVKQLMERMGGSFVAANATRRRFRLEFSARE